MTHAVRDDAVAPPDVVDPPQVEPAASMHSPDWDAQIARLQADVAQTDALIRKTMFDMTPVTPVPPIDDMAVAPKRSFLPMLMAAMLVLLVGGAALFNVAQQSQAQQPDVRNPLAMKASYDRIEIEVDAVDADVTEMLTDASSVTPLVAANASPTSKPKTKKTCRRGDRLCGGRCVKKRPTPKRCGMGKVRKNGRCVSRTTSTGHDMIFNSITP